MTLTAKNKGAAGNDIRLRAQTTASGTTTAIVAMASGATDPDIAPALANVVAAGHNIIVRPVLHPDHADSTAYPSGFLFPARWSNAAR
ncbi:Mu-like prophage tail sheath protein gpL [Klebsiella pneumoniae]|uniref:Mu-like prophage tail sheath protein gpL n=1 Tax=Klebsiella pneumoniae TaxID=573 RepID=A0A2X3I865_KLEPN|nr:Mu-like prophage tail sheath protein gpL [Klebsiella pneumoniae]